jgi:tetratricopeptide (TPR) repeat protein
MSRKGPKEIDSDKRSRILRIGALSLAGGIIGALGGWYAGFGVIPGFVVGFTIVFAVTFGLVEGTGKMMSTVYNPSGESTPVRREYSYPESLAVRGRYEDAIDAYQVCCADFPEDPEPYVRIARIYRDELGQLDEALFWFKRARSEANVDSGRELLITQEIIDIYTKKLDTPGKAIPELARIKERFPHHPSAQWASTEIARLRQKLLD